jgi:hypothetical protein
MIGIREFVTRGVTVTTIDANKAMIFRSEPIDSFMSEPAIVQT